MSDTVADALAQLRARFLGDFRGPGDYSPPELQSEILHTRGAMQGGPRHAIYMVTLHGGDEARVFFVNMEPTGEKALRTVVDYLAWERRAAKQYGDS